MNTPPFSEGATNPLSLLYIESDLGDESPLVKSVADQGLPYQLTLARSVAEANATLRSRFFDIVLCEYRLGDGNAFDLMADFAGKVVILIAEAGDEEVAVTAVQQGMANYLIKDPNRGYLKLLPLCVDIALRQSRAVSSLEFARELLDRTGELAKVGGWSVNLQTMKLSWTRETFRIAEIEPAIEPALDEGINLFAPEARPVIAAAVQAAIDNGTPYDLELPLITAKGRHLWVHTQGFADMQEGKVIRIHGTFQDITERKRADEALGQNQALLLALSEGTSDAIFVKDLQGRYLMFNSAASRYVGKPSSEVLGEDDTLLFPPEQALKVMANDRNVMESGRIQTFEEIDLSTDVGVLTFLTIKGPMRNKQGEVIGMFGISRDITKRKHAETELRSSEIRFRTLVDHSTYCVHEIDLAGRVTFMNRAGLKMLGLDDVQSILGLPCLDIVGDADRERISGLLSAAIAGQASEFVFEAKIGLMFQSTFVPIKDQAGTVQSLMGITIDITERIRTEQTLLANEARFRAIIDASPVPMALNDSQQHITFLNPAFVRTFGYSQSDIPTLADWWPKAYRDPEYRQWVANAWQSELARAAKTGTEFIPMEIKVICKDGSERIVLASAAPLAAGFDQTHLVLLYDISDRKRAEQSVKLAQEVASRAKSEFLANMSHEIRTPLTAILGFTDILAESETSVQTPERRKQIVETIKSAGSHLLTVVNDILDLSKIEADNLIVEKVETSLVNVLCDVERLMHQSAMDKGLVLRFAISSPLPDRILSDPTRLRQILMNLVGNAIKFTEKGNVIVTAGVEGPDRQSKLLIDIADTGAGLTPDQVQGLFKAFVQADSSVTRKYGGTGLGLVISRRLANILGGDVTLLYSEMGKGSCFRIVLPFEQVVGSKMIASLTPSLPQGEPKPNAVSFALVGRVLLAEDGLDNQRLIAFLIRKAGATIETADNGLIALNMLDQAEASGMPFDLLLTDMQMPEMDGYSLARTLRDRGSKLPIVALTAHAMADDRKKCLDAGCDDYVSKPIDRANLIATCARWLGKASGGQ